MQNKSIFYHIRKAIIDLETNRPITQEKYGKLLGYDKSTICINERKNHKPSLKYLYAVSYTTGLSLEYITKKIFGKYTPNQKINEKLNYDGLKKFL